MNIWKAVEFQGGSGLWYCNDTSNFASNSANCLHPSRILGMSADKYLEWLIENYSPDMVHIGKDGGFFTYGWKSQAKMRLFKNYINKKAREKNYTI